MAFLGHLGPPQSVGRGPRSAGQLGPLWPNLMRPKGGSQVGPKPQLDPAESKLVTNPLDPKLAKDLLDTNLAINPVGPIFGHGTPWTNIPAMASGNHQISSVSLPLNLWGILSIPSCHPYLRLQAWFIYGIIYHYAPFLLSNPIVTFSGPISIFPYQGLKIHRPFSKEDYSTHQSDKLWRQSEDSSRIPTTCTCRSWASFNQPVWPRPNWAISNSTV
ncbi:hypothetical protein O181_129221 [Austropuccinia psidii MF-1]|uniref:Uncharacterized protein n=1 Tax=Austropuccinia psidii MF-1 TaxID=1389203 RepID=A0A9Q3Q8D9_9BASI|nr:hypothetical protein [Austropuccinia psidii MF-1]